MPWPVWYIMEGSGYLQKETLEEHHYQYCIGGRKDLHYWALALLRTYSYWSILEIVKLSPSRAVFMVWLTIAPAKGMDTEPLKSLRKRWIFEKALALLCSCLLRRISEKVWFYPNDDKTQVCCRICSGSSFIKLCNHLSMFIEPFLINIIQTFKIRQHENNRKIGQRWA